jgi:hypothetical protein
MGLGTEWTPTLLSRLAETALRRVELTARVSLLRAPCGYGKSATLAAGWKEAADTGRPALWASLASDDTKKGTLRRLAFQAGTAADIESILQWIWHQDRPGIICLDDVQEAPHLETLTRDMMDALPDDWRAVLSTSAPWGFGVLNADWQEVGPDALACRAQDLKELIRLPSALDRIISDTQGWPALCRIAGRVSHRMQPLHLWPEIICYLDQMVLAPLSPALRTWLKKAALIAPLDAESHDFALRVPIPMKPPLVSEMIAPLRSEMMSPPRRQGRAGYVCCYFVRSGRQASEGDLTRRMLSPSRSRRWALWTSRSRMASA